MAQATEAPAAAKRPRRSIEKAEERLQRLIEEHEVTQRKLVADLQAVDGRIGALREALAIVTAAPEGDES